MTDQHPARAGTSDGWHELLQAVRRRRRGELDEAERIENLDLVMSLGCLSVPNTVTCSVTVAQQDDGFSTEITSSPLASELDDVQYLADDGPCLSAARHRRAERIDTMAGDRRWPALGRAALVQGVHSSLSIPVLANGMPRAMNFYGDRRSAYASERSQELAAFVARVTSILLLEHAPDDEDGSQIESHQRVMEQNAEIKRARSVLVIREGVRPNTAYRMLALQSAAQSRPIRQIVRDVLDQEEQP